MFDRLATPLEFEASLALGWFTLAFLAYFFSQGSGWVSRLAGKLGDQPGEPEAGIHIERTVGFIVLGMIPAVVFPILFQHPLPIYGVALPSGQNLWLWWLVPVGAAVLGSLLRPAGKINTAFYPQVRKSSWSTRRTALNALFWALYLAGYEFAFRGLLLFTCLAAFGPVAAVAINCALYSLSHIPKGRGEAVGAFFLGSVLCVIALATDSFVIPFAVHVIIAVGNDLRAVGASPSMHFIQKGKHAGQ